MRDRRRMPLVAPDKVDDGRQQTTIATLHAGANGMCT